MTMLAGAPPWTTTLSINLRCATPVLPIAIGRLSSSPLRPLPKEAFNERRQQTASAEIPIASDAPPRPPPAVRGAVVMGGHPKIFTPTEVNASSKISLERAALCCGLPGEYGLEFGLHFYWRIRVPYLRIFARICGLNGLTSSALYEPVGRSGFGCPVSVLLE